MARLLPPDQVQGRNDNLFLTFYETIIYKGRKILFYLQARREGRVQDGSEIDTTSSDSRFLITGLKGGPHGTG
jgi:hypothetical protein